MWRRALIGAGLVAAAIGARYWTADGGGAATLKESRPLMGTLWSIEVAPHGREAEARAAVERAFAEAARIEALMSEWRPETAVARINAAAGGDWVEVPDELRAILERAIAYGNKSSGAFDVTWRGMGRIWRYDDKFRTPSKKEVEGARGNVDYRGLQLEGNKARLAREGMAIGLGGIAKGYAVDRTSRLLREAGFADSIVAGAGDILASGTNDGAPWRVGIQDPRGERGRLLGVIDVSGAAVSTSGDYERFRMVGGVRYHHIIDPRTGWPARESISVSVKAASSEQADVLATAIFVLGAEKGLALADAEGVDVLIIDAAGRRHATGAFSAIVARPGLGASGIGGRR
ncbi:MAG: FAD:protein FMN transferase [Bryobacteraceae bacterium]